MNARQLKAAYNAANPDGHFFDADTMRFFGDTMSNFTVEDRGYAWALYRVRPVRDPDGVKKVTMFDKTTFEPRTVYISDIPGNYGVSI